MRLRIEIHGRRIDASPRGASGLSRLLEHAAAEGFAALEATVDEGLIHVLVAVLIGPVTEFIRARVSGDVGVVAVGAHAHRADAVAVGVFVDAADGAHRETDGLEADGLVLGAFEAAGAVVELGGALLEADPLAAAQRTGDADIRKLLGDLAVQEKAHESLARRLTEKHAPEDIAEEEESTERKRFILTYVQPGLAGLMDGSVSTLAPIFATAFATQNTATTFIVGLSASVGAGISMGFTEAAHDDGVLSGRGSPIRRGLASGIMTTLGGLGHALPYLIPHFGTATTVAVAVVFVELWAIAWIQNHWMETPWSRAIIQVVLGGALVFAAGMLIGSA